MSVMAKRKKLKNELMKGTGDLPAENEKEFARIVEAVIDHWKLSKPVDIMMANRMVSSWMKMRYAEQCLKKFGLHFEDYGDDGKIKRIRVNEFAYYLKQLESEFRSYYRLLNTKDRQKDEKTPSNFMDLLNVKEKK